MSASEPLDERIRVLCRLALAATSDATLSVVVPQLQAALAEHMKEMRKKAAQENPRVFRPESNAA
jgi:hypothetical protein